jgi:hypothetical protein
MAKTTPFEALKKEVPDKKAGKMDAIQRRLMKRKNAEEKRDK